MLDKNEIISLLIALVVVSFSRAFLDADLFLQSLAFFAIILLVYTFSKKIVAQYYESKEETKIWTFQRFGIAEWHHFKNPIPIGIILAFFLPIVSLGWLSWYAVTESEVKPAGARAVKRHDIYSFAEMTEWHLALISSAGIISMFILAIISYILNFPELAKLSIYFAAFNMIPISSLDGAKIFFGSRKAILWIILGIIATIAVLYARFLV